LAINKRKILESAQKHLQKGALEKALKDYQTLLGADPRDTNVRLKIGDLQLRRGDSVQAVEAYLKVAAQFMKDGFDAKAVAIYKQVHKINGERHDVWEPLAELYQRMGLAAEAMLALQTAADAHHQEGRRREALDLLRKMASLDPTNTTSRLKVAELLRADDRGSEAALEYREAAAEFERQGEREGAASALEKAIELQPDEIELYEHAVRVHLGAGSAGRAEPLARRLIELDPEAPSGYEQLATVLQTLGQESALSDVYRRLAEVHRKRGDEDQARAILQRFVPVEHLSDEESQRLDASSLSEEPAGAETLDFGDGHDLEIDPGPLAAGDAPVFGDLPPIGEGPSGIEQDHAPSAATADPGESPALDEEEEEADPDQLLAEASVYLRYGKHERAIASLQSVLAAQPRHGVALEKLGEAWTVAERPEEAVKAFVQAAELAREEADVELFDVLRGRVEALDDVAAAALGSLAPLPAAEEGHDYLDDEIEFSVDDGLEELDEEPAAHDAASREQPAPHSGPDEDAQPIPASAEAHAKSGSSHTTPEQIVEDFEAAEFYREQGMVEEAEDIYRRVLELAPSHPKAMLRLGEIEAARDEAAQAPDSVQGEGQHDLVAELAREAFAPGNSDPPAYSRASESTVHAGLAHELAEDSFGLGDETPDPFGFDDEAGAFEPEPVPGPEPQPEPEQEPELEFVQQPELEPEPFPDFASGSEPVSAPRPDQSQAEVTLPGLDALEAAPTPAAASGASAEAGGFDLAAALTDALEDDDAAGGDATTEGEGFASLLNDFKRGVHETLGEGDVESRYDLGIAYREMGLVEDAYEEFVTALESPARRYDALHMLAISALDLGRAAQALPRVREAIDEGAPEAQQPALRYDLGSLYEALGRTDDAIESFRFVAGIAPGFRDVEQRIGGLLGSGGPASGEDAAGEASPAQAEVAAAGPSADESFESFDDVVSAVEEADAREVEPTSEPKPVPEPEHAHHVEPAAPPEDAHGFERSPELAELEPIDTVNPEGGEELERPRTRRRKISFF
jgi:tetratricopeptide (TPR) repeat protein